MSTTPSSEMIEKIRAAIRENPGRMTMQLAKDLGVPEVEIVRQMPHAVELDAKRWQELISSFTDLGNLHVVVSNGGATLEAVGQFGNFSTWGEFFNVQTDSLDMHIRWPQLAAIFAVEKPSHMSGVNTFSFQFFDKAGNAAFKAFINFGGKARPEAAEKFGELRERFRLSPSQKR
jgi:putative hemin transport protein